MKIDVKDLLAKIEDTYGVDSAPDGSNKIVTKNCKINIQQGNRVTRDLDGGGYGADQELATTTYTTIDFEVEYSASGTPGAVPGYGVLLRACGKSETIDPGVSVRYDTVSEDEESVTLYYILDGLLFKITGAQGKVDITAGADGLPMYKFSFTGLHHPPEVAGAYVVNPTGFVPPVAMTAANTPIFQLDGYDALAESFSFSQGNEVNYRNVGGSESVRIGGRKSTGSTVFECPDLPEKDFFDIAEKGTLVPFVFEHGTQPGNIIRFESARTQVSSPALDGSDGIAVFSSSLRFVKSDAGDGDYSITLM